MIQIKREKVKDWLEKRKQALILQMKYVFIEEDMRIERARKKQKQKR